MGAMSRPTYGDLEEPLRRSIHHVRAKKISTEREQMSKQALAKVPNETPALARTVPDDLAAWRIMREQARELVDSGFLPRAVNTPEKALAIMQTGKELGLGPMQALRSIHIIEGKPTMSADLIAGLALQRVPGSTLRVVESTDQKCVIEAARPGHEVTRFTWTMADAQKAGLTGKDNWRKYPRAMLRARCVTEAARAIMPDAVVGIYDADELGAVTTPTGEVVELPRVTDATGGPPRIDMMVGPGEDPDAPPVESAEVDAIFTTLNTVESAITNAKVVTYEDLLRWREQVGTKGKSHPFRDSIRAVWDSISPNQRHAMGKTMARIDRQLAKHEGLVQPPAIEATFLDGDDGVELEPGSNG